LLMVFLLLLFASIFYGCSRAHITEKLVIKTIETSAVPSAGNSHGTNSAVEAEPTAQMTEDPPKRSPSERRRLAEASSTMSLVEGTGIQNHDVLAQKTVVVTAKDATGNDIGVGGELFYVQITNECTKVSDFE